MTPIIPENRIDDTCYYVVASLEMIVRYLIQRDAE